MHPLQRLRRQRRLATVSLVPSSVIVLLVAGLTLLHQSPAHAGHLAEGDPVTGVYVEPAAEGDATGAAVRSALDGGRPGPRADAGRAPSGSALALAASGPLRAAPTAPVPAVGALFSPGRGGADHECTASVVRSASGTVVVTAAHCVHSGGFRTDLAFVPGYHDGRAPYGVWVPSRIVVDPRWVSDRDPDRDVAFLTVREAGGGDARIEDVTGAERLGLRPPVGRPARVIGYPDGQERPVACQNTTGALGPAQLRLGCQGLPDGTSGGPLLTGIDPDTGLGTVVGVVGGHDEGGDDTTSYSSYFGDEVGGLFRRAAEAS